MSSLHGAPSPVPGVVTLLPEVPMREGISWAMVGLRGGRKVLHVARFLGIRTSMAPIYVGHKRWNDPPEPSDGTRILVCRYRPRGVKKEVEPWNEWWPALAPSAELHADAYGKTGAPINWDEYRLRYLSEMAAQDYLLRGLRARARSGEAMTLLCSSACTDPERCHRTLLRSLILGEAEAR